VPATLLVWITACVLSVGVAIGLLTAASTRPRARSLVQWAALLILFLPQNALGVMLSAVVSAIPWLTAAIPGWMLVGIGQAVPGSAVAVLLLDRALERVRRTVATAATLGAGVLRRLVAIALPALIPTIFGSVVAITLVSADDVIFVRYVPMRPVETFATELFARARYSVGPDLAAASVLLWGVIVLLSGAGMVAAAWPRLRAWSLAWRESRPTTV
jgi:ABC-type spermidine/putrescine transport system permease subunit II